MDDKRGRIPNRVVIVLVIIAVILASLALGVNYLDSGRKVPTDEIGGRSRDGGRIGVEIIPQDIEDKGLDNG